MVYTFDMYYVIKRQRDIPLSFFVSFKVPKYIASKNNDSVIFEFTKDEKVQRRWIKKDDIILLTEDKEFFLKIVAQFEGLQNMHKELVNNAREKLDNSMENFTKVMENELNDFNEIKNASDIPNILKDI